MSTEKSMDIDRHQDSSDVELAEELEPQLALGTHDKQEQLSHAALDDSDEEEDLGIKPTGISYFAAFINFVKGLLGVGCLALPLALRDAGLIPGLVLIIGFGLVNAMCMTKLVHAAQYLAKKKGEGRLELGEVAVDSCANSYPMFRDHGNWIKFLVNMCVIGLQMGVSSVYYVFVAVHLKELVDHYTDVRWTETTYMLLILVPFILVNLLRTLKVIAVISAVGNAIMLTCLVFIFQYLIRQDHKWDQVPLFTDFNGILTACGAVLYAFEGQAMVIPLENKLKKSSQMRGLTGIISTGMATVTSIYALCGFLGYITYGVHVQGSITLNLPRTPLYMVVRALLVLVVYTGLPIQQYIVIVLTFPTLRDGLARKLNWGTVDSTGAREVSRPVSLVLEVVYRALLVVVCMVVALTIPNLEKIIPMVGISCGVMLAFIFPPVFEALIFLPKMARKLKRKTTSVNGNSVRRRYYATAAKNFAVIAMGLFCLVGGLQATIRNLFK